MKIEPQHLSIYVVLLAAAAYCTILARSLYRAKIRSIRPNGRQAESNRPTEKMSHSTESSVHDETEPESIE